MPSSATIRCFCETRLLRASLLHLRHECIELTTEVLVKVVLMPLVCLRLMPQMCHTPSWGLRRCQMGGAIPKEVVLRFFTCVRLIPLIDGLLLTQPACKGINQMSQLHGRRFL